MRYKSIALTNLQTPKTALAFIGQYMNPGFRSHCFPGPFFETQQPFSYRLFDSIIGARTHYSREQIELQLRLIQSHHDLSPFGNEFVKAIKGKILIDLGCGVPDFMINVAEVFNARFYVGVDSRCVFGALVSKRSTTEFTALYIQSDLQDFLEAFKYSDGVIFHLSGIEPRDMHDHETIEYINLCLTQMKRLAKPGDRILLNGGTHGFDPLSLGFKLLAEDGLCTLYGLDGESIGVPIRHLLDQPHSLYTIELLKQDIRHNTPISYTMLFGMLVQFINGNRYNNKLKTEDSDLIIQAISLMRTTMLEIGRLKNLAYQGLKSTRDVQIRHAFEKLLQFLDENADKLLN